MKPKKSSARKKPSGSSRSRRTVSSKSAAKSSAKTARRVRVSRRAKPKAAAVPGRRKTAVIPRRTKITAAPPAIPRVRKALPKIPPILLEGDKPSAQPISGPGQRYALGPLPPLEKLESEGELPEAYGTKQLLLAARDPHWLYAHWDLTREQQIRYNSLAADRHLVLRVFADAVSSRPVEEIHVHPESRHWFIHVEHARTKYVAQLGYYQNDRQWIAIATSGPTLTPPDAVSSDVSAEFTAIPVELPMAKLLSLVKEAVQEDAPLAEAVRELRAQGHPELPEPPREPAPAKTGDAKPAKAAKPSTHRQWTPAQERALAAVISMDHVRRVWMGSMEITELIRRRAVQELASMSAVQLGAEQPGGPTSPAEAIGGISSPAPRKRAAKGFWFNVNAELIVYGATERDAAVTIGGRSIKLRPDGSFSYRFALPDGQYELPIVAVSADRTDGAAAELKFSRSTEYRGDVGAHPQDPALKRPTAQNLDG